jgi:hypothetical protein
LSIIILLPLFLQSQHYYRIKADFSFKQSGSQETGPSLVMGTAYYDKINKKLAYKVKFPSDQTWVMYDTSMYKFENNALVEKSYIPSPVETTIFNLALQSSMTNFGLEESAYTLENVEEDQGLVIATWSPPKIQGSNKLGKILIANQDGKLKGIVFKTGADEILAKQFYEDYQEINGIFFPGKVTQIQYQDGQESYLVTSYKNIVIDEVGKDHLYNFPVD